TESKRIVTRDVVIDRTDPEDCVIEVSTAAFRHTKEQAEVDFAQAQSHIEDLRQTSAEFNALLESRTVRYLYVFDDDNTRVAIGEFNKDGTFDPKVR
ncbi:MAG: hypothetical protein M3290_05395, partial [Actinomycetota bacterium]|nr:hypothetical protein [Actinomycetota bacterium]